MLGEIWNSKKNYRHKCPIFLEDVDIEKGLVTKKIYFDEKTKNTLLLTCIF